MYALDPSGVATTSPSPATRANSTSSTVTETISWLGPSRITVRSLIGDLDRPVTGADLEPGHLDRLPVARLDRIERADRLVGSDRGQRADAATRHAEHGARGRRPRVQSGQRGPVAAEGDQQLALRGLDRVGDDARLAVDRHLADLGVVRARPLVQLGEHAVERAGGMDDQTEAAQRGHHIAMSGAGSLSGPRWGGGARWRNSARPPIGNITTDSRPAATSAAVSAPSISPRSRRSRSRPR